MNSIKYVGPQQFLLTEGITESTTSEMVDFLMTQTLVELDLETTGLDARKHEILTIQFGASGVQYVVELAGRPIDPAIRSLLHRNKGITFIGHNLKFDAKFLLGHGIELDEVWDTMLAERVLHTGDHFSRKFNLAYVLYDRLSVVMSKIVRESFIGHTGPISLDQVKYAALDVTYLTEIFKLQRKDLMDQKLWNCAKLECTVMLSFADMEYDGLGINSEAWAELADEAVGLRDSLLTRMDDMVLTRPELERFKPKAFQSSMFSNERDDLRDAIAVKWSSQKDVLPIIQHVLDRPIESLDTKVLKRDYKGAHDLVDNFVDFVDFNKKATSFGHQWIQKYVVDGRVHTKIDQLMATGRVSSMAPNMQQVPSDARYRDCFEPTEGHLFITTDYGSQELVVIATGSNDPVWLEALENGHDLHSICAALVFGQKWIDAAESDCAFDATKSKCNCKEHKTLRTRTKAISFGLAYGAGAKSLSQTLEISEDDAEKLMDDYFSAFPSIKAWLDGNARSAVSRRESRTFLPIGRRRLYTQDGEKSNLDFKTRMMIDRRGRNTVIQGSAADMTKLAQIWLREALQDFRDEARLVAVIHDELLVEVVEGKEEKWAAVVSECMERAARVVLGNDLCKATPEIGTKWAK